ncbi:conserved exported hypothetical protein [Tenacibaculum maritimum]|uniref:hypothetical protein n=1 Tax=Tenacibaculum maritimum TaxID=107401 RepID=UPI0012E4F189|nr:hypothetical protein [Tenacibaculum maritimum]CAA0232870.1 conserved exported hypothetical protein [Tenacibaculum maritimum]
MKTRKKKLSKFLKVGVCLLGISLLLWSCEKEEEKVLFNEIQQEKTITHISLDEFTLNVTKNSKFKKLATFFDVKKKQSKIRTKVNNDLSVRILTNDIIKIKKEAFTSYTFRILLQNDDDFMYNLVLYVNNRNEIYKSFILKYIPSEQRILDTPSSYFKGKVSLLKKDILLTNNLILLRENADCLTGGTTYWECSYGYEHAPGTCNASSFEYIMELEYGECNNGGGGEITVTPTDSSEGGASGGSQDGGIVTAPHTTSYTSELKNFVSDILNAEERNYYTSHNNIKNTIDTYLIQKNFSNLAKFEAKLAVEFGNDLNLNPQNFIWFFSNRNSKEVQDIKDFLAVNNNAIEAEEFAGQVIKVFVENPDLTIEDIDFDDQIIDLLTGKAKCLNDSLTKNGNTFIKDILKKFQGVSEFDINIKSVDKIFRTGTTIELNGKTIEPLSGVIEIHISTNKLSDMPALGAARTLIHEYIHADMFRKLNTPNPTSGDLDFKSTYEKYETEKQHNSMAELYVNSIRDALKSFHKSVLVGDYNYLTNNGINPLPDNFYEALAWQGLKEHNVQAYTDLSSSKKTELTNALNTHYHSTTKNCSN